MTITTTMLKTLNHNHKHFDIFTTHKKKLARIKKNNNSHNDFKKLKKFTLFFLFSKN